MTLAELKEEISIQGNVTIQIFNERDEIIETHSFLDFEYDRIPDRIENMEVTYMYADQDQNKGLVIELKEKGEKL